MTDEQDLGDRGDPSDSDGSDSADSHDDCERRPPDRREFEPDPIGHVDVRAGMTVGELVDAYGQAGIGAAAVHEAADVCTEMLRDKECTVFLSLAGAMVPAGMRTVVSDLIRDGHIDALITTGANLTHDAIEAIGGNHHHGRVGDETESSRDHDERLREEEVDRIYDVYLPQEHFAAFESHLRDEVFPVLEGEEGPTSIARLCAELGRANAAVNDRDDIAADAGVAAAAYESDVPVSAPAVVDSVLGLQAWMYAQTSDFALDALGDVSPLTDLAYEANRAGCVLVGGGVPKNFTLQTMLVTPDAYRYAVQITMDPPETGGLSGATLDEARSWGKLRPDARNATITGDATVFLPLLVAAVRDRLDD